MIIFAGLLLVSLALSTSQKACNQIPDLTDSTFNEVLATSENLFVEFYAKWCAHCRKFEPVFELVSDLLVSHPHIKLAKVDIDQFPDLADRFGVDSYPVFKLFRKGEIIEYTSDRQENNMADWLIKHTQPYIHEIQSKEELASLRASHRVCFVMLGSKASTQYSAFLEAAKRSKGICYGLVQDTDIINYGPGLPVLFVYKQDDDKFLVMVRFDELEELFERSQVPWVMPLGDKAVEQVFEKGKTGFFVFSQDGEVEAVLRKFSVFTNAFAQLAHGDLNSAHHEVLVRELGLGEFKMPFAVIVDKNLEKYVFEGDISVENLKSFYTNFRVGKAERFYKSEKEIRKEGVLTKFVGTEFVKEVTKTATLVAFTIPNCGYCRILIPILESIASKYPNLRVGYIDLSLNEIPGLDLPHFPSLAFYSQSSSLFHTGNLTSSEIEHFLTLSLTL